MWDVVSVFWDDNLDVGDNTSQHVAGESDCYYPNLGVSKNCGSPNSWMVYFMENPI